MALLSEFRDGNVPAGDDMLRIVKESLAALPDGVNRVRVRMYSAGYQHEVLKFCATGDGGKRDVIEFTVSNDMTEEFRRAALEVKEQEWKPLYRVEGGREVATGQQSPEVVYVPNAIAFTKDAPVYRYLAIRELVKQGVLPGMHGSQSQMDLPFATIISHVRGSAKRYPNRTRRQSPAPLLSPTVQIWSAPRLTNRLPPSQYHDITQ